MTEPELEIPRALTEAELLAQKRRNVWLAVSLVAFVVIVLAVTIVRISEGGASVADGGF
ncbi:MAG: hypothetical protein AAFR41_10620 [Pseudomonadota bacterium]